MGIALHSPTTTSDLTVDQAAAYAAAHGWSDDSRWTPRQIHSQISHLAHGLLSAVRIWTDGTIDWRVTRHDDHAPALAPISHGQSTTLGAAINACQHSVAAATCTLF